MKLFVGIDVGKMFLDVNIDNQHFKVGNDKKGFKLIEKQIEKSAHINSSVILVCEASGGYEKKLVAFFNIKKYATHVAHANKIKAFARSKGYIVKTDRIDSKIICEYAKAMDVSDDEFKLSKDELSIKQLIVRREQLRAHKQQEKTRLDKCSDTFILHSVKRQISFLEKEIIALEKQIEAIQQCNKEIYKKVELLCSIPAVGRLTAQYVIAFLPELGSVSNKQLAALVGVAPYNRDSGKYCGKRFIQGGRIRLRNQLYMVAISSVKHNPMLSNFYKRLRLLGKPAKVALVAVIRKLLTILNSVLQRNYPWNTTYIRA